MKYKTSIKLHKLGYCIACGAIGYTEFHHVFGRTKALVNDERFIVELCKKCHQNPLTNFKNIVYYLSNKFDNWIEIAEKVARERGKFKELRVILEVKGIK